MNYEITETPNGEVTLSKICGETNEEYSLTIPSSKYELWQSGQHPIQNVFPELKVDEREFILTGITPNEWEAIFDHEDENPWNE